MKMIGLGCDLLGVQLLHRTGLTGLVGGLLGLRVAGRDRWLLLLEGIGIRCSRFAWCAGGLEKLPPLGIYRLGIPLELLEHFINQPLILPESTRIAHGKCSPHFFATVLFKYSLVVLAQSRLTVSYPSAVIDSKVKSGFSMLHFTLKEYAANLGRLTLPHCGIATPKRK